MTNIQNSVYGLTALPGTKIFHLYVIVQGRRIGYLDYRFVDEADWFTEQQDDLFDIPISTLKVGLQIAKLITQDTMLFCGTLKQQKTSTGLKRLN